MILEHYGLPPITGKHHFKGKCPLCDSIGKFHIDDHDGAGTWICTCNYGTELDLVIKTQGEPSSEVYREIDKLIGDVFRRNKMPEASDTSKLREKVLSNFAKMTPLCNTLGASYLNFYGIFKLPVEVMRLNSEQRHNDRVYQSTYSLITGGEGELHYPHQTLLDGAKKADIRTDVKQQKSLQEDNYLGHARPIAIRMFPATDTLGIAEDIETALSTRQAYDVNTWVIATANFMKKLRVSADVRHLIIFADRDENSVTRLTITYECTHANLLMKNDLQRVSVYQPDRDDLDNVPMDDDRAYGLVFHKKKTAA